MDAQNVLKIFSITPKNGLKKATLIHGNKYNYSKVNYLNSFIKVKIYCNKCNNYFWQTPAIHLQGHGCGVCSESAGEIKIISILNKTNTIFKKEKYYKDLVGARGGHPRFDFYLPNYNICIEYDGRQHFDRKYHDKYFKHGNYDTLKANDRIKSKYCRKNKVKLVRIPYWNYNKIEEVLTNLILNQNQLN